MNILESVRLAFRALAANKLRAALTMLGIVIGVAAVITLMSVGEGVQVYIAEQFQSIGTNLLFVVPGQVNRTGPPTRRTGGQGELTNGDVQALRDPLRAPDVAAVSPEVSRFAQIAANGRTAETQVQAVTPDFAQVRSWGPEFGAFVTPSDIASRSRVAVLGQTVAEKLFPDNAYPIGESLKISGVPFRVVGVMEEKGGSDFGDQDDTVFIPLSTAQTRLYPSRSRSGEYRVSLIMIQAVSEDRMDAAAEQAAEILRERHGIIFRDEDDFSIISQAQILDVFGEITSVLTIFLGAIAGISLLVGGIGIMNIMLVSVTERTREIGLRKAVGARRRDILAQFLLEAVVLAVVGGLVGILLGAVGAQVISQLRTDFRAVVSFQSVALATGFSAAVGLFFGIYPARRASALNPIDALRYD